MYILCLTQAYCPKIELCKGAASAAPYSPDKKSSRASARGGHIVSRVGHPCAFFAHSEPAPSPVSLLATTPGRN